MTDLRARRDTWTFLTSHARVLLALAQDPSVRMRDVAATCRLTERAVQAVVADLEAAGYLTRARVGRRNRYTIVSGTTFRHPAEAGQEVAGLLGLLMTPARVPSPSAGTASPDTTGRPTGDQGAGAAL